MTRSRGGAGVEDLGQLRRERLFFPGQRWSKKALLLLDLSCLLKIVLVVKDDRAAWLRSFTSSCL